MGGVENRIGKATLEALLIAGYGRGGDGFRVGLATAHWWLSLDDGLAQTRLVVGDVIERVDRRGDGRA